MCSKEAKPIWGDTPPTVVSPYALETAVGQLFTQEEKLLVFSALHLAHT